MTPQANQLIHSQSPYLLQHAYNPVSWYPWGREALEKAQKEDKPIIVSIGYSACHWCHVMERESFENEETAQLMNEHFVCIKIDREERPDLDNIYMDALQAMGLQGGWPLNVFLMPNQKPFYGGTYFPPQNWRGLLGNIAEAYQKHRTELEKSAEGFGRSLQRKEREKYGLQAGEEPLSKADLIHIAQQLKTQIDPEWGGLNRTPKFPMPSVWLFLLDYAQAKKDPDIEEKVLFTLKKIGMGGIYDHLAGGFARYSVDGEWFAPHFEKMLYDNGQLLDLYAKAYLASGDRFFKEKVTETVHWIQTEMCQEEGGFYAALDADSEGEEGKFYTWTKAELDRVLGNDLAWLHDFYSIKDHGNWENGVNILFQTEEEKTVADRHGLSLQDFQTQLHQAKKTLLQQRSLRQRPGTDDKTISGWNGLTISGLVRAYWATNLPDAKQLALQNGEFILERMMDDDVLYRSYKNGKAYTPAFLEDYATVIQAFIDLYPLDFDKKWLEKAKSLTEYTLAHFWDEQEGLFYFNNPGAEKLIANKKEIFDNVIPSSNSIMARNLHQLGCFFYQQEYLDLSGNLLKLIKKLLVQEPGFLTNWARLYLEKLVPTAEVAIVGKGAQSIARELAQSHWGNQVIAATENDSEGLPLLADKVADPEGNALIYVCFNKACQQPVSTLKEALVQYPTLA